MKQQQEMYWDEENEEFIVYDAPQGSHNGKTALYIVGYFFVLAVMMVPAERFHLGMQGIFIAMIVAGALLGGGVLIVKFVKSRVESMGLSKKGFIQTMVGFAPEETIDTTQPTTSRALAKSPGTALIPLDNNDEPPDRIVERDPMDIADDFKPSVNGFLGAMVLMVGIRRSGKSNGLAVLAEEIAGYEVPMVIFDTEDEYGGLASKDYLVNPAHAGNPATRRESPNKDNYVDLDIEGAYAFGRAILDHHLQVVVNLKGWLDDDAAVIMAEMIDGLNDWEDERENADRIPVMVFLDEAQKWLPQNTRDGWVDKENQTKLHHAFFDIVVARGGKRGFGLVVATQRYSQINKNVLQSQWKFLFKQTEEIDVAKYAKQGLDPDEVAALRQGECFIFSPLVIGFKTMLRERTSPHQANTPGLDNLRRTQQKMLPAPRSFAGVDGSVETEVMPPLSTKSKPRAKTDLERVIEVFRENPELSYREIAGKVGFGKDKVGELLGEAKERGMLD